MQNQEHYRRKTRSQLVDEDKQASRPQIQSQNYVEVPHQNSDIESSKIKQQKQLPARKSNWIKKQNIKYLVFLNYYSDLPYWSSDLKSIPTYKSLSQFVKTRSPEQCKSFHLSTRRNFKSIEEEIKGLQQELEVEEGYQKLLDKYELQILGFEEEHGILKLFDLEEKRYFHNKFVQTCKQTGFNKKESNISGESPHEPEYDYNPKINIKQLIKEKQGQQKKKQEKPQNIDTYQPLINMHYDNMQQDQHYLKGLGQNLSSGGQKVPTMMMPNPQHPGMGYYGAETPFNPIQANKTIDKSRMDSMRLPVVNPQAPPYGARTMPNHPNERMIQQNMGRMMEPNRNMYNQYPNYGPYGSSPFAGIGQMHMPQFRNQMPYSMPPPGGIPYMIGYNQPYGMGNIQPRYGYKVEEQSDKNKNLNDPQGIQSLSPQKNRSHSNNEQKQQKPYSQRRKQLLLNCHQHWVNWLRSVTELNRRKQMDRNLVSQ